MITWLDGAETPAADAPAAGDKKQVRRARERKTKEARADKEQRLRASAPGGPVVIVSSATHAYIVATEGCVLPTTFAPTAFQHGVVLCAVARLPKQGDAEWIQTGTRVNLPAKQDAGVFICAYKVEGGIVCLILKSDGSVIKPRLSSVTVFSHMDMSSEEIRKLHERGRAEIELLRHQPSPPVKAPEAVQGGSARKKNVRNAAVEEEEVASEGSSSPEVMRTKSKAKAPASAMKSKRRASRTKDMEEEEEEEEEEEKAVVPVRKSRKKAQLDEDVESVTLEQAFNFGKDLRMLKMMMKGYLGEK